MSGVARQKARRLFHFVYHANMDEQCRVRKDAECIILTINFSPRLCAFAYSAFNTTILWSFNYA